MIDKLQDRIAVITGAGSGIGRATALAFAKEGARIAACDLDEKRLATLGQELGDRLLLTKRVDMSDRAQVKAFADEVHAKVPAADVVVNNAGVGLGGTFLETTLDDWDWVLGVNLRGVIYGCHFFIPKMVARGGGGHVVNISSILGIYGAPGVSAYAATKFAVRGMSMSMREELKDHGIGVTAICPGMIATAIIEDGRIAGELGSRKSKVSSMFRDRGAPPSKVASAILDAVRTNPAVRTVGADAHLIAALSRVAPKTLAKLGSKIQRRYGAH